MSDSNVTLAVEKLSKRIGKKDIIKNLSFQLKKGEVFGFLGPNGAGKTTTIRMLVGLIRPSSGQITICGHNLRTHFTEAIQHLGCIVENPELYPYLTGWENLEQFARMGLNISENRLHDVVRRVGLENRIHDRVKTYSLGMRQRLGIAQALLNHPSVLILDEPTNGLDPAGIRDMRKFIRQLAESEGLSVLVSSHLLSEIQLMCDRVAIIVKGEIIKTDTVEQLLSQQAHMVWVLDPQVKGQAVLSGLTKVRAKGDGTLTTPYEPDHLVEWHKKLIAANVGVYEMRKQLPTLEDLFLTVTGGEAID